MAQIPFDYAARNLFRSPVRLALSLGGAALVVLLVLASTAFVGGMSRSLVSGGQADNVILLGAGSEESIERSEISPSVAQVVIASVPGIRSTLGVHHVSPEVYLQTTIRQQRDSAHAPQVMVRGITPAALLVHRHVQITAGRLPEAGRDEILIGALTHRKMGLAVQELALGRTLHFDDRDWTIVGAFAAPGAVIENEILVPLSDLQIAARRDGLSCVVLTLDDAELADIEAFAHQRLDLELVVLSEQAYYRKLWAFFAPIRAMVWITALLIASGGVLGGLNTMYAAFASRVREVGALQAIGFSRRAVAVSFLQESMLASSIGTLLAIALGVMLLDGVTVQFSTGTFGLMVDSRAILMAIVAGVALGVIGAIPPAIRCLRMPITDSLKSW